MIYIGTITRWASHVDEPATVMLVKNEIKELIWIRKFERNEETKWAYRKVLSHLEDGWTHGVEKTLKDSLEGEIDVDLIGHIGGKIIGGYRENTVGMGEYPTQLDICAFLYHETLMPPKVMKRW